MALPIPRKVFDDAAMMPLVSLLSDMTITAQDLAARWRYSEDHLSNMRRTGKGPAWFTLPTGGVRYRLSTIIGAELAGEAGPITLDRVLLAVAACESVPSDARAKLQQHLAAALRSGD